jgi:hypothetical protein
MTAMQLVPEPSFLDGQQQKAPDTSNKRREAGKITPKMKKKFDGYILIAANDLASLRKSDVYRVLQEAPRKDRAALGAYIKQERSDLAEEANDALEDINNEESEAGENA